MWETLSQKEVPFVHWLLLHGLWGEIVRVKALFDGRAMVGAMCTSFFKKIQHRLSGQTKPSNQRLRVVNGVIVLSQAVWSGVLELGGLQAEAIVGAMYMMYSRQLLWGILISYRK